MGDSSDGCGVGFLAPILLSVSEPTFEFLRRDRGEFAHLGLVFTEPPAHHSQTFLCGPAEKSSLIFLGEYAGDRRLEKLLDYSRHPYGIFVGSGVEGDLGSVLVDAGGYAWLRHYFPFSQSTTLNGASDFSRSTSSSFSGFRHCFNSLNQ